MSKDTVSDPIKKCIECLKDAKDDTQKFAALFMVTKLVKGKDCSAAGKKALFEAIGFKFLKKLLKNDKVSADCPPAVYKSVVLTILSAFLQEEQLATHKETLENISVFLDIVQTADDEDNDDSLIIVSEAYSCLQCIANYEPGQKALLDIGAIKTFTSIYSNQSFQTDEALNLIVALANKFGSAVWPDDPKQFNSLIQRIGLDFETDHTDRKFDLCNVLAALLQSCKRNVVTQNLSEEIWPESLFKGLNDTLKGKLGKTQREAALKLAGQAVVVLGIEWTLNDVDDPKIFFLHLLQLVAVEVRMQMDGKSFKQTAENAELLIPCFSVLELSVNYMSTDQLDLEQKEKQTVYTALKGAFAAVSSVLSKLEKDKAKDSLSGKDLSFTCAIIRVLSSWLALEPSAMRPAIYQLLPFILKIVNQTFHDVKKFRDEKSSGQSPTDVLRVLMPALCHLAVEEKARKVLFQQKQEEVFFEALQFYFSIAHYKRPPIPRAERLKRMNEPDPIPTPQQLEDMKDARAAIISLCNILMNLTVLEPKIVEASDLFNKLQEFIFENLPLLKDIPENLVMHGNLATLGLLLLKQQAKKVKKNDFTICRYIQATIRFLWDAYIVDESNDPTALVVAMAYKEHWAELAELWFLGMQTMSGILAAIPWISDFAIESGWAEGIIETLKKVKIGTLPANVKSAYEDFLCQLVAANQSVVPVLKKADALRVCRNHRLMELGKKLFGE